MADIAHVFGGDLSVDATGDIAVSDGAQLGQELILRRLLTNLGGYIWSLDYGGGIASFIGRPAAATQIAAVIRSQMFLEAAAAKTPAPVITVKAQPDGSVIAGVRYADAITGAGVSLTIPIRS